LPCHGLSFVHRNSREGLLSFVTRSLSGLSDDQLYKTSQEHCADNRRLA
jgi:hypothetical protein